MKTSYLAQISCLLLTTFVFASFAQADKCESTVVKIKDKNGVELAAQFCAKDSYYVVGDGVERNQLLLIKGPYIRQGIVDEQGQFQGQKSYPLRTVTGSPWCARYGKSYLVDHIESDKLFAFVSLDAFGSNDSAPMALSKALDNMYTTTLYCSNQYMSLDTMALNRAMGDSQYVDRAGAMPIKLSRQSN